MDKRRSLGILGIMAAAMLLVSAVVAVDADAARAGRGGGGGKGGKPTAPSTATVSVSPNPVPYGSMSMTVSGSGFAADEGLVVTVYAVCCGRPVTADANGAFTMTYFSDFLFFYPGTYTLEVWNPSTGTKRTTTTFTVASQ